MSNPLKMYHTYSVFVGHIPPNTKKYELRDLFKGCGEIVDVVIIEGKDTSNFGFVRYTEKESAFRAVSELNHWSINGRNIIVAIEKNTALKLEKEETGLPVTVTDGCGSRKQNLPKPVAGKCLGTDYITDTMYWTRLQESCTALNLRQSNAKHLSINHLAEEINRVKGERTALWGSIDDASTSFAEISRKIMQRCRQKADQGEPLGKKNQAEFMCALRTIMKEINEVLETKSVESVEYIEDEDLEEIEQLKLEGNLVREVNDELVKEIENDKNKGENSEDEKLERTDRKSKPKRHSDVIVQTVNEIDHRIIAYRKSLDGSIDCFDTVGVSTDHVTGQVTYDQFAKKLYFHSSDDGTESDLSSQDPAIMDYHFSKLKEIDETKNKHGDREQGEKSRSSEKDDIFKMLCSKFTIEKSLSEVELVRSNSRDSSLSEGSNEGNVDDSGVESDFFGIPKVRRSLGLVENMLGVNSSLKEDKTILVNMAGVEHRKKFLKGSTSEPSLGAFDLHLNQYVKRSMGRGRGIFSIELEKKGTKQENIRFSQSQTCSSSGEEEKGRSRRGMLGAVNNLKMPIGRGHLT